MSGSDVGAVAKRLCQHPCRRRVIAAGLTFTVARHVLSAASAVRSLGDGTFTADLPPDWTVGNRPHGGFLLALLAERPQAATSVSWSGRRRAAESLDPLAVSAQFLRPPEVGPVLLRTEVRKLGRTAGRGRGQPGTARPQLRRVHGHRRPDGRGPAAWSDLPDLPAKPPADALDLASVPGASVFRLSRTCEVRIDPANAGFLHGRAGDPLRLRMWVKAARGEHPDLLFGLVAGDISMPVTFNLGRYGWSPTVQLTGLLRGQPGARLAARRGRAAAPCTASGSTRTPPSSTRPAGWSARPASWP